MAAGNLNLGKASGGVLNIQPTDGTTNTSLVLPDSGELIGSVGNQTIGGIKTFSSSPIVPTPTTGTQAVNKDYVDLKVALASFVGDNQSLSGNGYQKLPGGLIIQWGTSLSSLTSTDYRTFPIAFPNACLVGCAGYNDFGQWGGGNAFVVVSKSQFLATSRNSTGAVLSTPTLWIAIGY